MGRWNVFVAAVVELFKPKHSFRDYPEHIRAAAFRYIKMPSVTRSYLGGSLDQVAEMQSHINRVRRDARGLPPGEFCDCVMALLRYYESRIPEIERELVERTTFKELEAYKLRRTQEEKMIAGVLRDAGL